MLITRHAFLRTLGSMAAIGCGFSSAVSAAPRLDNGAPPFSSNECGAAAFAAHLHSRFRVTDSAGHRADLELTHVHEFACDPSLDQFSLVFEDAGRPSALEGICHFDHPALGRQTLFITAGALANPQRAMYQASFNRRRATPREA